MTKIERLDFFKKAAESFQDGLIVDDTPVEVLADLSAGKFKDIAMDSLGEEMPMFVLKHCGTFGIPPWNKEENPMPERFAEIWFVPVGGKLAKSRFVCKLLKPLRQLRIFAQKVKFCQSEGYHPTEVVWTPKFVAKTGTDKEGKPTSYYQLNWDYRPPQGEAEQIKLELIVDLLTSDPELDQLQDDSTGLLYIDHLSKEEKSQLFASVKRPVLMPTATLTLPE